MAFYFLFSCLFLLLNAFQTYGLPAVKAMRYLYIRASETSG